MSCSWLALQVREHRFLWKGSTEFLAWFILTERQEHEARSGQALTAGTLSEERRVGTIVFPKLWLMT